MKPLWTSEIIDQIVTGRSTQPWTCTGFSIDTRTLERGDLFVALEGENSDGHQHVEDAFQKGAAAALVSQSLETALPLLKVEDALKGLEKIGIASRKRCEATRFAITGSVGKTSTKEALKWVLQEQGPTHASVSSYNNHWGVPLTLARMPQDTQYAIFEVGMNHPGEIRPLTHMIEPQIVIITPVVEAHLEFFNSVDEIARAKAEIFEGMSPGSPVILYRDNPQFDLLSSLAQERGLKIYSYGEDPKADFKLLSFEGGSNVSQVKAEIGGKTLTYKIGVPGRHWAVNSLSVLGAVSLAGANLQQAAERFSSVSPPSGRGGRHPGLFTVLDESYNANPTSMRAALEVLGQAQGTRKIAVIGDMREIGELSRQRHEELLTPLLENKIDLVYCCGPFMSHLFELLPPSMKGAYTPTSQDLIPYVLQAVSPGDVISVKASLGTRVKPIVEALLSLQEECPSELVTDPKIPQEIRDDIIGDLP